MVEIFSKVAINFLLLNAQIFACKNKVRGFVVALVGVVSNKPMHFVGDNSNKGEKILIFTLKQLVFPSLL
jgi:hypothetical protein